MNSPNSTDSLRFMSVALVLGGLAGGDQEDEVAEKEFVVDLLNANVIKWKSKGNVNGLRIYFGYVNIC